LDSKIFEEIEILHRNLKPNERIWTNDLAIKYGYPSSEALRSAYRRRKKICGMENAIDSKESPDTKIFVYDLECSYMQVGIFSLFDQNVGVDQIITQSILICWSGKFLDQNKVLHECLTPEEALNNDDSRIVKSLWETLNSANILIGHNIISFDNKKINLRFLAYGLPPIKKQNIDTYVVAKKQFEFPSNSLKGINQYLGIKQKKENEGFLLWRKCMAGDPVALNNMQDYCDGDVLATSELYYKIRPFITNPPKISWFYDNNKKRCSNCGSVNLRETGNFIYLSNGKYSEIRCECGAIMRTKNNLFNKEKKSSLLI
jgi:hypothetical protein